MGTFYQVIGMANAVLKYAPGVIEKTRVIINSQMDSHLTEAYFLAWTVVFYILVRNFREVPFD